MKKSLVVLALALALGTGSAAQAQVQDYVMCPGNGSERLCEVPSRYGNR